MIMIEMIEGQLSDLYIALWLRPCGENEFPNREKNDVDDDTLLART